VRHSAASWRADLRSVSDRRVDSSLDFGLARTSSVRSRLPPDRGRMPEYFLFAVRGHTVVTDARRAEAVSAVGEYTALLAGCAHVRGDRPGSGGVYYDTDLFRFVIGSSPWR
jgi:hypothetical protein